MARKLKVYRTPIGFHDAYVAAPNQKAALDAWGSDADLFARGVAELVTDAKLTAAPLDRPGEVIRLRRGTDAENMAALPKAAKRPARRKPDEVDEDDAPPSRPRRRRSARSDADYREADEPKRRRLPPQVKPEPTTPRKPKARRRPGRNSKKAEAAIEAADAKHRQSIEALREQERALARQRRDLEQEHEAEMKRLEARVVKARDAYGEALRAWRG